MSADEWLEANGKGPWHYGGGGYDSWHWATYLHYHGKVFTEAEVRAKGNQSFTLPVPVWDRLLAKTTYPYVKTYGAEGEALEDFRQAYDRARAEGWAG